MPPGTKLRNFRCGDLWDRAKAIADERGESMTSVLVAALERYIKRHE